MSETSSPSVRFKIGDRVRLVSDDWSTVSRGELGTVVPRVYDRTRVAWDNGETWHHLSDELELIKPDPGAELNKQIEALEDLLAIFKTARDLPGMMEKALASLPKS